MHLSTRTKAILALVATGILGGASPLFMKIALKEFSSYQILFIRFSIATLIMSPFLAKYLKTITFKRLSLVIPSGILFSSNVFFFIVGLQYTTSIVSQLFYLLVPVIVSIISYIFFREKTSTRRIISMIICFGGATLLIIRSVQGGNLIHSIGTFQGNLLILCAVVSWSFYSVYTKHISKKCEPSFFLVANFVIALLISCISFFVTKTSIFATIIQFGRSSFPVIMSLIALGILNSVVFVFLFQWSLKYVSAFVVTSTAYLGPLSTALFAIPFFGERLSTTLLISAASIFIGSYLILSEKK